MNRLSKTQLNLLDFALDILYTFLKMRYSADYSGNNIFSVYDDIIHVQQCKIPPGIAWSADIVLKDRKIYISIREAERDTICSRRDYDLIYMKSKPTIHTVSF